jgi:hypothetical protein
MARFLAPFIIYTLDPPAIPGITLYAARPPVFPPTFLPPRQYDDRQLMRQNRCSVGLK